MFCPKCAMKNIEGAHFCRSCGANISLVPQALTGQLPTPAPPEDDYYYRRRHRGRALSPDYATRSIITGIAFAVMAVMVSRFSPGSARWWFWLLVPAIMLVARGFSEFARIKSRKSEVPKAPQPMVNAVRTPELPVAGTGELMTPVPSVTEGTTRHLGTNAETRPFEFSSPQKPS
ncbi:MAG TPA: zinc ribbon domain-containing protein [Pyrinomonadaceae bacterium]|jgi:zinc ribbon protein|nr:zinc ribbon domain-containing protein [Pyrinomonadaceae bacterium]